MKKLLLLFLLLPAICFAEIWKAEVLTPYVWNGYSWTVKVCEDYKCEFTLTSINHSKTMPPVPNLITAEITTDDVELAKIKTAYKVIKANAVDKDGNLVIGAEDGSVELTLPEKQAIVSYLVTAGDATTIAPINRYTREEMTNTLREEVKKFKKTEAVVIDD